MLTRRMIDDDSGASAVEYGLLLAAVAAVLVIVVFALGGVVQGLFGGSCAAIDGAVSASADCAP